MAVLQGEFCAIIASILCQAKWPVYRGGRTSESRNSESLLYNTEKKIFVYIHVSIVYGIIVVFCGLPGPQEE